MRKLIGGSLSTAVAVALCGATVANARTPAPARAASFITRDSSSGPIASPFATPFASIAPTVDPSISGTPEVDDQLTADPGSWPGSGLTYTYQWFDCDPSDLTSCAAIPNATDSTYTVDPADGDSVIVVAVDATDGSGNSGSATSAPTAVVTAQPGAPVESGDPTIGSVTGGQPVTATVGSWTNNPTSYAEAWIACDQQLTSCSVVASQTESGPTTISYTPTAADAGEILVFAVVASNATGDSVEASSTPSVPVVFPAPSVSIIIPAPIQYAAGTVLTTLYSCTPPPGMALESCVGTVPNGSTLDVVAGDYDFVVTATDADGRTGTDSEIYGGLDNPLEPPAPSTPATLTITAPVNGATVVQGSPLDLSYVCPGICSAVQHPSASDSAVAAGGQLDTTELGVHTVTVNAQAIPIVHFGQAPTVLPGQTASVAYTVVPPPLTATSLSQSSARWKPGNALPATTTAARAAAHAPGTRFALTTSRAATATFTFSRLVAGRVHGKACVAATRANRRAKACTRAVPAGAMTLQVPGGPTVISFDGRLSSTSRLRPGRYSVAVIAEATATPVGSIVQVGTLRFTIVK
jgi:hypothetical protein